MGFFSSKRHGIYKNVNGKAVLVESTTVTPIVAVNETFTVEDIKEVTMSVNIGDITVTDQLEITDELKTVIDKVLTEQSQDASILPVGEPVRLPEELIETPKKKPTKKPVTKKKTETKTKEKT